MAVAQDTIGKVTALVIEQLEGLNDGIITVDPKTSFSELGFDWMAQTELVMRVEETFGVVIDDENAQELLSVQAIVTFLQEQE